MLHVSGKWILISSEIEIDIILWFSGYFVVVLVRFWMMMFYTKFIYI